MLPRHPLRRRPRRHTTAAAIGLAAAGITSPLALPKIARDISRAWEFGTDNDRTLRLATSLADAGLLLGVHLDLQARHRLTLKEGIEAMLAERFTQARPRPVADLTVNVIDDVAEFNVEWTRYASVNHLPDHHPLETGGPCGRPPDPRDRYGDEDTAPPPEGYNLGALVLGMNLTGGDTQIEVIGPALNALEAWPQLGQTVLDILEGGLMDSTRCLSPGTGIDWASRQYWGGEDDESDRHAEELDDARAHTEKKLAKGEPMPTDETLLAQATEGWFTRADYDASCPAKWHRERKPLRQLPLTLPSPTRGSRTLAEVFQLEAMAKTWPQIRALCETIKRLRRRDHADDNSICEHLAWEATPFMLRMAEDDCLPRLWDDTLNDYMQSGEDMDCNAVFLWHDTATLARAVQRCANYLALAQACEDLIRLLAWII